MGLALFYYLGGFLLIFEVVSFSFFIFMVILFFTVDIRV